MVSFISPSCCVCCGCWDNWILQFNSFVIESWDNVVLILWLSSFWCFDFWIIVVNLYPIIIIMMVLIKLIILDVLSLTKDSTKKYNAIVSTQRKLRKSLKRWGFFIKVVFHYYQTLFLFPNSFMNWSV